MAVKMSAQDFAAKQAKRLKASTEEIKQGVMATTENPAEKAIAKQDKMIANLTTAVQDGKWAAGLKKVSLADWQSKMINKGIGRISAGIDAAHDKVVDFAEQLLPHVASGQAKIASMPDLTLDDNLNRMTEFARHMSKFKKQ